MGRHSRASIGAVHGPRPATPEDADAIARVWHAAWHEAHGVHVPATLVADRPLSYFQGRVPDLIRRTTVVSDTEGVVGFVTVTDDELDLLFVAKRGRGTGVAVALLVCGEQQIAAEHEIAWLDVVTGNARARAFYARQGWRDGGPVEHAIDTSAGPAVVHSHRYEKWLR